MSTFGDTLCRIEAEQRAEMQAATFGHLAPERGLEYRGWFLFAIPEYDCGTPCIVSAEFDGLNDSPWFYDAMWEFAAKRKRAGFYRFDGVVRNYRFKGVVTRINTTRST